MPPRALGRHLLLDLYGCPPDRLDDPDYLRAACVDAVRASGGTVLGVQHHRFEPQGVTVVVMVSESHVALHTWPEHAYVGVDYFTCGDHVDPGAAAEVLLARLAPGRHEQRIVARGDALEPARGAPDRSEPPGDPGLYDTPDFLAVSAGPAPEGQVAFVLALAARCGPLRSGVELACGAAPLSVALAERGVRMTAVDASAAMLEGAGRRAAAHGVTIDRVQADMRTWRASPPVDLVTNLGLNCAVLDSQEALVEHLEAVADSLRPNGLYLVDFEHCLHRLPPPVGFDPPWLVYPAGPLYVARGEGVEIRFADGEIRYDPIRQRFRTRNTVVRVGAVRRVTRSVPSEGKIHLPLEVRALVAQTRRFDVLDWYADYRVDALFDGHPEADRFVMALRRR